MKRLLLALVLLVSSDTYSHLPPPNPSIFLVINYEQTYSGTAFELNTKLGKVTVTNAHICGDNSVIVAVLENPRRFKLLVVKAVYTKHDLCILTPVSSVQALDLADDYDVGDKVSVEGFPQGRHGFTEGTVGKFMGGYRDYVYITYRGAVFHGNSGSPVLDSKNKVIGVISIGTFEPPGYWGGFVPLEYLKDFIDSLAK